MKQTNSADCADKQTNEETFHCLQTEATDEIQRTQAILTGNQGDIKQTLDTMNGSLSRIFSLYEKQDLRLDNGDIRFQEIRDFMIKKDTTNGHIEKDIDENKHDINVGHDNRLLIETRLTTLESNYTHIIKLLEERGTDKKDKLISKRTWLIAGFTCIAGPIIVLLIFQLIKTFIWKM